MDQLLQGQKALVTGANSGLGASIVQALAAAGAEVALNYVVGQDKAEQIAQDIRQKGGKVHIVQADVSKPDQVEAMFKEVLQQFGALDILVNNAGIQNDAPFLQMSLEQWNQVLEINLTGYFLCAQQAAREFVRRGIVANVSKSAGKIICISSVHQVIPWAGHCNYATSKGGIQMFMKTLAQELSQYHIRVNSIAPGAIETSINHKVWANPCSEKNLLSLIPYGRIGLPEDVAQVAVWLASDQSDYVQGTTIFVDGGMCLYPGFTTGG